MRISIVTALLLVYCASFGSPENVELDNNVGSEGRRLRSVGFVNHENVAKNVAQFASKLTEKLPKNVELAATRAKKLTEKQQKVEEDTFTKLIAGAYSDKAKAKALLKIYGNMHINAKVDPKTAAGELRRENQLDVLRKVKELLRHERSIKRVPEAANNL
ncbi:hypothetical protein F441_13515 [Phytophthora nicotianae CJ01A1]|uniref:RxLR effector protein n=5 Tax=Phytophthora nicotianae TaxID=4792 RepID=V9ERP5_PHYNI|nr:hypothetical protein F443_13583 [Phytophthora nicotianae P1569]ETK81233.1 hypothetical protein L915_13259 [Phytophthora nicotianae]ETO69848.1 hypothetical protein F444_13636 [Phytophthora nicotianae P1976]ETP10942.1 hypothetical protein F441_13515 [Phytophthora nicotianae CJ01A1]ETP39077.1 hypothetical protein F442_13440 [Phytophthora nicotianae P10297]